MKEKKLIAIDLDGTLLNEEGKLSSYTVDTIQKIREAGHTVIIATGRPYRMAKDFYQQLQLDTPMINFNGSLTHIPNKNWKWEKSVLIEKEYFIEFLQAEERFQADFIAGEYKKKFFITQTHLDRIDPRLMGVEAITPETLVDMKQVTKDPHSILMQTRAADKFALAEEMRGYFKNELEINTWGGPLNILETCAKGVTKAFALNYLLDLYQASPNDLIAFGDEQNDTQMLQFAGTAYAMKNANPILLPYADHITEFSNTEDGVAKELEKIFL
ncbi:Cof-type HAD-IIB family hydrolase [Streptococcus cameli]